MGFDLVAKNSELDSFHFNGVGYRRLLEVCGYLFPTAHNGSHLIGISEQGELADRDYFLLHTNDGFKVTAEEARIMARMVRNFVRITRAWSEPGAVDSECALSVGLDTPPPEMFGCDTGHFEQFAEWAEMSEGFAIY